MFLSLINQTQSSSLRWLSLVFFSIIFMVTAVLAQPGQAQDVEFQSLMAANNITCLMESGTKVFGGLNGGGLMVWDADDPTIFEVWNSSTQLSGNNITDLALSGTNLWVSTLDAGVTRIEDADTNPRFRQYSGSLSSPRITAVTAAMIGEKEQAYYAMDGAGVGSIFDGLPGFVFTTLDGLLSNDNNALQIYNGELFVASDLGISRFNNNLFTTQNTGLTNVIVKDLTLDAEGNLLAGGNGGLYRWDSLTESWTSLGGVSRVDCFSTRSGEVWTVGSNILGMYNGTSWSSHDLPRTEISCVSAGTDLWIGGRSRDVAMSTASFLVYLGRREADDSFAVWDADASLVRNADGITIGANGDVWIGSWAADAVSRFDGENYNHFFELGDADNGFSGLFNHYGNFLCLTTHPNGTIWAGQFGNGALIIDPETGGIKQVNQNATGMDGGRLLRMVAHPDGTMLFMHDREEDALVDVLVDVENYDDDANWLSLPRGLPGLGNGLDVYDALVERNDVIWFAVGDVGLVRWDINGPDLGPDDEITWLDTSDDHWYNPVTSLPSSGADPKAAKALALASDGSIWLGGNGVARFTYNERLGVVETTEESYIEKTSPYIKGLVSGDVSDIALDRNGDLWVTTVVGLNRIRKSGSETIIDAYMDVENYLSNPNYGILYSINAIAELPSGSYKDMAVSTDRTKIAVSSDRGAVLISIAEASAGQSATLDGLYCYPNPFILAEAESGLSLGGLVSNDISDFAAIEIFNIEGQLVYSNSFVTPGEPFWSGVNRVGEPAVTGMYVMKVVWQNMTAVCPLSVVR